MDEIFKEILNTKTLISHNIYYAGMEKTFLINSYKRPPIDSIFKWEKLSTFFFGKCVISQGFYKLDLVCA